MDPETIKVECLKLAADKMTHPDAAKVVQDAETLWRWVTDASPVRDPGQSEGTPSKS